LAETYATRIAGELAHKPFDRDLLDRFAERARDLGPVFDLGCGPGHVTRYLADRGLDVTGIDLSAGMVEVAKKLQPDLRFAQGSMLDLDRFGHAGGLVAFYAIIHIPSGRHIEMYRHWSEVLIPGGLLMVAFHLGEEVRHLDDLWGEPVSLDFHFFSRSDVERWLTGAGFAVVESHERDPYPGVEAETRRGYVLARNDRAISCSPA
jgi:SAM-dependent methyltransferase